MAGAGADCDWNGNCFFEFGWVGLGLKLTVQGARLGAGLDWAGLGWEGGGGGGRSFATGTRFSEVGFRDWKLI